MYNDDSFSFFDIEIEVEVRCQSRSQKPARLVTLASDIWARLELQLQLLISNSADEFETRKLLQALEERSRAELEVSAL